MVGKKPETAASTGSRVHGTYSGLSRQAAHGHHGKGGRDMRTVALRVATCQAAPVDYPWRVHCPRRGAALAVAQTLDDGRLFSFVARERLDPSRLRAGLGLNALRVGLGLGLDELQLRFGLGSGHLSPYCAGMTRLEGTSTSL